MLYFVMILCYQLSSVKQYRKAFLSTPSWTSQLYLKKLISIAVEVINNK